MHRCLGWNGPDARAPGAHGRDVRGALGFAPGWMCSRCDLRPQCLRFVAQQALKPALSACLPMAWCCPSNLRVRVHHGDHDRVCRHRAHESDGQDARRYCCQRYRLTSSASLQRLPRPDAALGAVFLVCRRDRRERCVLQGDRRHGYRVCRCAQCAHRALCVRHGLRRRVHRVVRRVVRLGHHDHRCDRRCVRPVWR